MNIAIFNSFICHYEIIGYILHFCKTYNYSVTIYGNDNHVHATTWKDFYTKLYPIFYWTHYESFTFEYDRYDYVFLITDDDFSLSDEFIFRNKKNMICIDHSYKYRRYSIDPFYHIGTRPFIQNYRKWAIPCYPIINDVKEKVDILTNNNNNIHIVILGGQFEYNIKLINRISSKNNNIILHIISRTIHLKSLYAIDKKFTLYLHENISVNKMMDILKRSKYIVCDMVNNRDHINGKSMSGSIPFAFNMLSILIISNINNAFYDFKSALTFNLFSNECIEIDNRIDNGEIQKIYDERNILIDIFHNHINEIMNR
jgi:hypothetical protein